MGPSHVSSYLAAALSLSIQWCNDTSNHASDQVHSGRSAADNACRCSWTSVTWTSIKSASLCSRGTSWYTSSFPDWVLRLSRLCQPSMSLFVLTDNWNANQDGVGWPQLTFDPCLTDIANCTNDAMHSLSSSGKLWTIASNAGAICSAGRNGRVMMRLRCFDCCSIVAVGLIVGLQLQKPCVTA